MTERISPGGVRLARVRAHSAGRGGLAPRAPMLPQFAFAALGSPRLGILHHIALGGALRRLM